MISTPIFNIFINRVALGSLKIYSDLIIGETYEERNML